MKIRIFGLFTLLPAILLNLNNYVYSQIITNNGAGVISTTSSVIFADGGILNKSAGTFDHSGYLEFRGDFTNNGGNTGFINSSPGLVVLSGANQVIDGSNITYFYDLSLMGSGVKSLDVDAYVEDSLALNDREMAAEEYTLFMLNSNVNSISRTNGFVSSLDDGGLARNTLDTHIYHFPVGSSIGTFRYRPVDIIPNSITPNTYKVRMANVDATSEGYDRTYDDSSFCLINPDFYHRIGRLNGMTPADIAVYFDNTLDNNYTELGHWQNSPRWENTGLVIGMSNISPNLSYIQKNGWDDFGYTPFALGIPASTLSVSNDTTILSGDQITLDAFGALDYNWSTGVVGNTNEVSPFDSTTYFVFSSLGCPDTAYVTVNVISENSIYIPNIFSLSSGNIDNEKLFVFGTGIKDIEFTIYDRWGEMVYRTEKVISKLRDDGKCCSYTLGWNGKHQNTGELLNNAVFAYIAKGSYINDEAFFETGSITLLK